MRPTDHAVGGTHQGATWGSFGGTAGAHRSRDEPAGTAPVRCPGMPAPLVPFHTLRSTRGMVCSVDHLASNAGVQVLRAGGSAADAAVALESVLSQRRPLFEPPEILPSIQPQVFAASEKYQSPSSTHSPSQ